MLGGALGIGVLSVYVMTLSPGLLGGDPGELQFVPYILGLTHPTGMLLYVLLGKVWVSLPLGYGVAWRMNLLAALSACLAITMVYASAYVLTGRLIPALSAALILALGRTFWKLATTGDKYAFNALMLALVILIALRWGETWSRSALYLLFFTYGLSLTHHRTMLLFGPPLLLYVWWREGSALWRDWRRLLRLAGLSLAPLVLYLYVPWAEARNLPPGTWHPQTVLDWLGCFFPPRQVQHVNIETTGMVDRLAAYGQVLRQDVTWPGVLLGLVGMFWQLRRRTAQGCCCWGLFPANVPCGQSRHAPSLVVLFAFLSHICAVGRRGSGARRPPERKVLRQVAGGACGVGSHAQFCAPGSFPAAGAEAIPRPAADAFGGRCSGPLAASAS